MAETPHKPATSAVTSSNEQAQQQFEFDFSRPPPTNLGGGSSSDSNDNNNNWHLHRQNHNPSKLPAFRFADLRKDSLAAPSLLTIEIPALPVSAGTVLKQGPAQTQSSQRAEETLPNSTRDTSPLASHNNNPVSPEPSSTTIANQQTASPNPRRGKSRPSTFHSPLKKTSASATRPGNPKRSASLDASTALDVADGQSAPHSTTTTTPTTAPPQSQPRRAPSYSETLSELRAKRSSGSSSQNGASGDEATKEWAQGQRELLLPKAIQRTDSDGKRSSLSRRPPVSYRPPIASTPSTGGTAKIPPIRSFRSSGDRHTLGIDMNLRSPSVYEDGHDESSQHDWTLQALEGRRDQDTHQITPPDSAVDKMDADDSGDLFLKMSREEPERPSAAARVIRSAHRRPLSSVIPSYQPMSPPQVSRRLSEQDSPGSRAAGDGQPAERMARALTYRSLANGNMSDSKGLGPRPLSFTPRSLTFQDSPTEQGSARKPISINDSPSSTPSRRTSLKQPGVSAYSSGRPYNPSPLAPKFTEPQKDGSQVDVHTESSTSTAAPSTVWDELEDIRSRIHRLELTGKLPATSGAAISRASEERPPTATTNATTMSASPKRSSGNAANQADAVSTVSSSYGQKEGQPLLQSAMTKSKAFLAPDVYNALESAATDAITLAAMIGKIGEPGPVSSAASNVGTGTPVVTDRQLRRKAEGICRSLTELCLALSENSAQIKQPDAEKETDSSPTITRFTGVAAQRRPSVALVERSPAAASPRGMSRLEERRSSMLFSSALPSPSARYSSQVPGSPIEAAGRRTSLMLPRARRAGTAEPEDSNGRRSSILRTRRAGTEEPDDISNRKFSVLRTRRGTYENEEEDSTSRFRAPSRAITEVAAIRPPVAREFNPQIPIPSIETTTSLGTSALPRRRLAASTLNTRLVQPSASSGLATRRYLDRTTPDRGDTNNLAEKLAEDRGQRPFSLAQNDGIHSRSGSLHTRTRDSMFNSSAAAQSGGYR